MCCVMLVSCGQTLSSASTIVQPLPAIVGVDQRVWPCETSVIVLCVDAYLEHDHSVGPGSGVPFHTHGPTFAETVYGRKVSSVALDIGRSLYTNPAVPPFLIGSVFSSVPATLKTAETRGRFYRSYH